MSMRDAPRPARSMEPHFRSTRVLALVALLAFVAAVVSDDTNSGFWAGHPLLAGLASSVIVVLLTVAVVNEVLERRSRHRWRVLAQYVMFELVRNARMIWSGMLEVVGSLPTESDPQAWVAIGSGIVRDTPRLTSSLREAVDDPDGREHLHREVAFLAAHSDEVLGRWAAVMLNADAYAEVIDRHVELAGDISWIAGIMDGSQPPSDLRQQKRARSNPAVQIEADLTGEWLTDRLVVIAQLAEELDRGTLDLALQIVPVEWWRERLGTDAPGTPH